MKSQTRRLTFLAVLFCAGGVVAQTHTHGDMVGSVLTDQCVVWTRSSSTADVSVFYATNSSMSGALVTPVFRTGGASDFIAKFKLKNLKAATRYYYRTKIANPTNSSVFVLGPVSTFVTAPTSAAPATFCFIGDINSKSLYHMFARVLVHQPDLCLNLGDFPYADGANQVPEYWVKHKNVRNDARVWDFYRNVGLAAIWDDHEVENDWDANTSALREKNGIIAWKNYFPLLPEPKEIYHSLKWGPDIEFFLLDNRSHRGRNEASDVPSKTMLGTVQKTWLKSALAASKATFKVICSSVPIRFGTTNLDSWTGYQRERGEILAFINANHIRNVVILTADQHWGAVHHLREGIREFQSGPIATGTRAPLPYADPERVQVFREINYGIVRLDPTATPKTLTVELHGVGGLLHREVIRDEAPARCEVECDVPEGRFSAIGPVLFRNSNRLVVRESLEPGAYSWSFPDISGVPTVPSPIDLTVLPGADLRIAARWHDVPDRVHPILLNRAFEGPMTGFTIVDEGTSSGPSAWFTDNGYLQQSSNILGGTTTGSNPVKPGTMAITGSVGWTDYTMTVRVRSKDDDALGVIFRYRDARNYYRFSWSAQHNYQRLTKKVGGLVTVLAQRSAGYIRHRFHDIRVTAIGSRLTVYIDGTQALTAVDASNPAGRVGFYTWGNFLSEFDDLVVRLGEVTPTGGGGFPGALFEDRFGDGTLTGWTISDQGTISAPSKWTEANGVLTQSSNIYGGSSMGSFLPKPGTMAVADQTLPNDLYFETLMNNPDNDGMGVVFRFKDVNNHYRFSWDAQRSYRRLAKVVGGTWSLVKQDSVPFLSGRTYRIATQVEGNRIRIYIDGTIWADLIDGSHASGKVGLYAWGSQNLYFDDVLVLRPVADPSKNPRSSGNKKVRPVLTSQLNGRVTDIVGRHAPSSGQFYTMALSFARSPGIPLALVNAADPRSIELAPDSLFFWSLLTPTPILTGFNGTIDSTGYLRCKVNWPNLPGTKGAVIYCGGWITDRGTSVITEVLPSVAVVFP